MRTEGDYSLIVDGKAVVVSTYGGDCVRVSPTLQETPSIGRWGLCVRTAPPA
jgi:hypothetical protein